MSRLRGAGRAARRTWAELTEAQERMILLNRPWEEEYVHGVGEGADRRSHGHRPPPKGVRQRSVTRGGWCPGPRD